MKKTKYVNGYRVYYAVITHGGRLQESLIFKSTTAAIFCQGDWVQPYIKEMVILTVKEFNELNKKAKEGESNDNRGNQEVKSER